MPLATLAMARELEAETDQTDEERQAISAVSGGRAEGTVGTSRSMKLMVLMLIAVTSAALLVLSALHKRGPKENDIMKAKGPQTKVAGSVAVRDLWMAKMSKHNDILDALQSKISTLRKLSPLDEPYVGYPSQCVINSFIAIFMLMQTGNIIAGAVESTCKPDDQGGDHFFCAADGLGVFQSTLGAAAQLSALASTCPMAFNQDAACATDVMTIIGSAGAASQAIMVETKDCSPNGGSDQGMETGRRLEWYDGVAQPFKAALGAVAPNTEELGAAAPHEANGGGQGPIDNPINDVWCTIDIGAGLSFLAQAADFIRFAVMDCEDGTSLYANGSSHQNELCAANVLGVVGAFSNVIGYISVIGDKCVPPDELAKGYNVRGATCAGDIGGMFNALISIAQSGIMAKTDCATNMTNATNVPDDEANRLLAEKAKKALLILDPPAAPPLGADLARTS